MVSFRNGERGGEKAEGRGMCFKGVNGFRRCLFFSPQVHVLQIFKCSSYETSLSNPLVAKV